MLQLLMSLILIAPCQAPQVAESGLLAAQQAATTTIAEKSATAAREEPAVSHPAEKKDVPAAAEESASPKCVESGTAQAAKQEPAPIVKPKVARQDARDGTIILSSGKKIVGKLFLTQGKRLRVFDPKQNGYRDFSLTQLSKIDVRVTRERVNREWRFEGEGSAVKLYTGRSSVQLNFDLTLTLPDGRQLPCSASKGQPINVQPENGKKRRFLIPRYVEGKIGQERKDLEFVKQIILGLPAEQPEKDGGASSTASEQAKDMQGKPIKEDKRDALSPRTGD